MHAESADRLALLEALLDRLPMGIAVFDRELRLRECNPTWAAFIEAYASASDQEATPGTPLFELAPETESYLRPLMERVLAGETIGDTGVRLENNGRVSYWDVSLRPLVEDGQITGVIDVAIDATARVEASELATEREAQFQQLFASTNDAVIINDPETGVVVEANEAACRMHGYTHDEFVGLHPTAFIHADSLPLFANYMDLARAGGDFRTRAVDIRKDGTLFEVEVSGIGFTYKGRWHLAGVVRDVSEQVKAERALAEQARLSAMAGQVGLALAESRELEPMLQRCAEAIVAQIDGSAFARIWVCTPGEELILKASAGLYTRLNGEYSRLPLANPKIGAVARNRRPFVTNDVANSRHVDKEWATRENIVAFGAMPMLVGEDIVGVLALFSRRPITEAARSVLGATANEIGVGIRRLQAEEHLRGAQENLERLVEERTSEIRMLLDVSNSFAALRDLPQLLNLVLERLKPVVDYAAAAIFLLENDETMSLLEYHGPIADSELEHTWRLADALHSREVIRSRAPVIIEDVQADTELARAFRRVAVDQLSEVPEYIGTWMGVPLLVNDEAIGLIAFDQAQPGYYTEQQASLALAFANQTAAVIQNARNFAEEEARGRELARALESEARRSHEFGMLLDVARSVSSTLDRDRVLRLILGHLRRLIDSTGASVLTLEDGILTIVASTSPNDDTNPAVGLRYTVRRAAPIWDLVSAGSYVVIDDVLSDDPLARAYRAAVGGEITGAYQSVRSWIALPLELKGRVIGMLTASRDTPGGFNTRDAELATALASQAAIAIENARLYSEAEARTRELSTLLDVSSTVASTLELGPLLALTLEQLEATIEYSGATIFALTGEHLRTLARRKDGLTETRALRVFPLDQVPVNRQVMETKIPIIIDDIHGESEIARVFRRIWDDDLRERFIAMRSWMGVPLISRGNVIGMMTMEHAAAGHFTRQHASLALAFAARAAIAIENARLFEEIDRSLREARALTRVASNLTFDQSIESTLDALSENVVAATRAVACTVVLFDDERGLRTAGIAGMPEGYRQAIIEAWALGLQLQVIDSMTMAEVDVLRHAVDHARSNPAMTPVQPLLEGVEWDTVVRVPVVYHGRLIGSLTGYYRANEDPDQAEIGLLNAIADQAAVAFENARLFEVTERRLRELEALYRADEQLHQSLRVDDVMQALVDVAVDIAGADKSLLVIADKATERLGVRAARGYAPESIEAANLVLGRIHSSRLNDRNEILVVEDAEKDPRTIAGVRETSEIGSYMDLPVSLGDRVFGIFDVAYTEKRRFSEADKRLFQALAQRAAVALENARLFERSQKAASLEERQRLARELHDSVSQALYGIALGAKTARTLLERDPAKVAEPLDYVLQLAEAGLAELRSLIFELRPESLETEGLLAAFNKQIAAMTARHGINVQADFGEEPELPPGVKEAVYRIGQEALNNTVKHARASNVRVALASKDGRLVLSIEDDGRGFDPGGEFPGHMGLQSMKERAEGAGGTLSITSAPGQGAKVVLAINR